MKPGLSGPQLQQSLPADPEETHPLVVALEDQETSSVIVFQSSFKCIYISTRWRLQWVASLPKHLSCFPSPVEEGPFLPAALAFLGTHLSSNCKLAQAFFLEKLTILNILWPDWSFLTAHLGKRGAVTILQQLGCYPALELPLPNVLVSYLPIWLPLCSQDMRRMQPGSVQEYHLNGLYPHPDRIFFARSPLSPFLLASF